MSETIQGPRSMSDRKMVSVVTGTIPDRLDLLFEAMANLRRSDYPRVEHCYLILAHNSRRMIFPTVVGEMPKCAAS